MVTATTKLPALFKRTSGGKDQIWEIWVEPDAAGGVLCTRYGLIDGKQQTIRELIKAGKNTGKANATTPLQQACNEAQARWNKQRTRKGYAETAAVSAQIRGVSPMLAHKYPDHFKKIDWANAFAQPKLDGFRCLVRITTDGDVRLDSRENQPLHGLADLADMVRFIAKNTSIRGVKGGPTDGIVLDGEAYCHGLALNHISSACKKKSDLSDKIVLHLYDAMIGDADFKTRNLFVKDFVSNMQTDRVAYVETVKVRNEADLKVCEREFLEGGYEGAMLRHGTKGYEAGKRSASLLKVKTHDDDEFVIVDSKLARGKYEGCPVFVCKTPAGHFFDVLAPGSIPEKQALGRRRAELVGARITVHYFGYTDTAEPVPFQPVGKVILEKEKRGK